MVSIGGVNVVQALVEAEMRILVLENILDSLLKSRVRTERPVDIDLESIREQALKDLQTKYPELGIKSPERYSVTVQIRSPLGAIGAILVALEGVAGASLVALDSGSSLQMWMVAAMIFVFVAVTLVVLGIIIYFAVRNPAYLFSPSDISESAHSDLYAGSSPRRYIEVSTAPDFIEIPTLSRPEEAGETCQDE